MKTQKAHLNYLNIAPRKVRFLVDTLRGLSVSEAQAQLLLSPQRPADRLLKLIRSAAADAKQAGILNTEAMLISQIWVDSAPTMKRSLPRSMGRATPILKRMSHVTVILSETEKPKAQRFVIALPEKKKKKVDEKGSKKPKGDKKAMPTGRQAGDVQPKPELKAGEKEKPREVPPHKSNERGVFRRFFNRKSI